MNNNETKASEFLREQTKRLAYEMWESAGRQEGLALDYWLAAEREILNTIQISIGAMIPFESHLEPIGVSEYSYNVILHTAYKMWESAGRQYGFALDYWLAAENEVLTLLQVVLGTDLERKEAFRDLLAGARVAAQVADSISALPGDFISTLPGDSISALPGDSIIPPPPDKYDEGQNPGQTG